MKLILFIILILALLIGCIKRTHEKFTDIYINKPKSFIDFYRNDQTKGHYSRPILPDINNSKSEGGKQYITSASTLTNKDVDTILSNISFNQTTNKYIEQKQNSYSIYEDKIYTFSKKRLYNCIEYCENKIINEFKKHIKNNLYKYYCPKYAYCIPSCYRRNVIRIERSVKDDGMRYHFTIEILINNKSHSHIFYVIAESVGNAHFINYIRLIGIEFTDKFIDNIQGTDTHDKYINIYTDSKYPYMAYNDYYRGSDEKKQNSIKSNDIKRILSNKKCVSESCFKKYKCYGKNALDILECEMPVSFSGKQVSIGKWDRTCQVNSDCPYYKKNKNYPNSRGGCKNGWCEMPLGLKQISPRNNNSQTQPLCHNCQNLAGYCCDSQKSSKFKSPDYVFKDDFIPRYKYKNLLSNVGLNVY